MDEHSTSTDLTLIEGVYAELDMYSPSRIEEAGQVANRIAARNVFTDYRERRAANTLDRQDDDLQAFARYLASADIISTEETEIASYADRLRWDKDAWAHITWGLVSGFVNWMKVEGYSIGSINMRLTTVKVYAGLAKQAGTLPHDEYASMRLLRGYRRAEGKNVDRERPVTRKGAKKAETTPLTREQANALKHQPNTPQGRRDAVLMCFLLEHGLRVGELTMLTRQSLNMSERTFLCERPKVHLSQLHRLTDETVIHLRAYLKQEKPQGPLLLGSRKGQEALTGTMSKRAIQARVRYADSLP